MNCLICRRPMRPSGATLEAYPNTVAHAGRSLCWKHYSEARRTGFAGYPELDRAVPGTAPSEVVRLARNPIVADPEPYHVAGRESFLRRRRERLARQAQVIPSRRRPGVRVDLDRTTGLWAMSKGGVVIGLAVSEELAWEQLRDLTRMAAAA